MMQAFFWRPPEDAGLFLLGHGVLVDRRIDLHTVLVFFSSHLYFWYSTFVLVAVVFVRLIVVVSGLEALPEDENYPIQVPLKRTTLYSRGRSCFCTLHVISKFVSSNASPLPDDAVDAAALSDRP